jgi:hypothetical protein
VVVVVTSDDGDVAKWEEGKQWHLRSESCKWDVSVKQ